MNALSSAGNVPHYRAVFISDTHLGTKGCRSDFLADFLGCMSCDKLFLVGDIVDGWKLRKSWYWDKMHDKVVRLILRHVRNGTQITYVPGNHDEMFRPWLPAVADGIGGLGSLGLEVAGITVQREAEHTTAAGMRLLVIHGDEFDGVMRYAKFLAILGSGAYTTALVVNRYFQHLPALARLSLLVAQPMAQAAGQGRGQGDRPLRMGAGGRSAPPWLRWRGVRPHPPRRNAGGRRRALLQRRRLGRELHGAGRARGWPARTDRLGRHEPPVVPVAAPDGRCAACLTRARAQVRRPCAS